MASPVRGTIAASLATGAVNGGRVITDCPRPPPIGSLRGRDTQQRSDLAPTTDLRSVIKGLTLELFDASPTALAKTGFPDEAALARLANAILVEIDAQWITTDGASIPMTNRAG